MLTFHRAVIPLSFSVFRLLKFVLNFFSLGLAKIKKTRTHTSKEKKRRRNISNTIMKRVSAKKKKSLNRNDSVSKPTARIPIINLDNSSSSTSADRDSDSDGSTEFDNARKKRKLDSSDVVLPVGFLAPLPPPKPVEDENRPETSSANKSVSVNVGACKQFWKAGDYEVLEHGDWDISSGGIDHVRVHPKFLHSNATSHKWALGAFAELLDNSLDEVCNGATYVNIDVIENLKNGSKMLLIEDNGGGMDPDKMRQCMSLGYSAKSKVANSIGQYGNGFKTSTMRLGADVIVFSRCCGSDGRRPTQSIGLLSYTFLRSTGKEDIVVPMLDYESDRQGWKKLIRSSTSDWDRNVETVVQWSPFSSEADLLCQFNVMQEHGTRIIIYNLWEDDEGYLELNFDADPHDIQLRGVNRDEKNITMASQYPNSKHFLTYRHSLRSYASILYLRLPPSFRIILRGQDVLHHNIVNDMMMSQQLVYRPQCAEGVPKDINMMTATVTVGFVKDAKHHIDVQGFNVYHKNRLIKPFWRIWNSAGSDGRGVIGVLEANFVEPAHDKQGFERTTVLARLESKLLQMQKNYWQSNCHRIGYAPRRNKKENSPHIESSPDLHFAQSSKSKTKSKTPISESEKSGSYLKRKPIREESEDLGNVKHGRGNSHTDAKENTGVTPSARSRRTTYFAESSSPCIEEEVSDDSMHVRSQHANLQDTVSKQGNLSSRLNGRPVTRSSLKDVDARNNEESSPSPNISSINKKLNSNISSVSKKLERRLDKAFEETDDALECENCAALQKKLEEAQKKVEELNKEQESLIDIFSEERERRDKEEENLRKKLKEESKTIQELLDKIKSLER